MTGAPNILASGKPRKSRGGAWTARALLAFMAAGAGWCGLWYFLSASTLSAIEAWFANEGELGREWACAEKSMSGFPFSIVFHCGSPTLRMTAGGRKITGSLESLVASAHILEPSLITASLAPPLAVAAADGSFSATAAWRAATIIVRTAGAPGGRVALEMSGAEIRIAAPGGGAAFAAARLAAQLSEPAIPSGILELRLDAGELASAHLDQWSGDEARADLALAARITSAGLAAGQPLIRALEAWRAARGTVEITTARFAKGPLSLNARGTLGLDERRRLAGAIDADASGAAPLLQKFGVPPAALTAGSLLGRFLPGQKPPAENPAGQALRLPLKLQNGRVFIGVFPTPVFLPPLY